METIVEINTPQTSKKAALFLQDKKQREQLNIALMKGGFSVFSDQTNKQDCLTYCQQNTQLDLLVVEESDINKQLLLTQQLQACTNSHCIIIMVGGLADIAHYKLLLNLGIKEYYPQPYNFDQLFSQIIALFTNGQQKHNFNSMGCAVWGMKGGVGCSIITANVSSYLANQAHHHLLVIDLDLYRGDLDLHLNSTEMGHLAGLLSYGEGLDSLLLSRSVTQVSERLSLLNDSLPLQQKADIRKQDVSVLVELIATQYRTHLWDLANCQNELQSEILKHCQTCILVCELTLPSIRELAKALSYLKGLSHVRPIVVVNQVRADYGRALTVNELQTSLSIEVDHVIDFAPKKVLESMEKGQLLVNSKHRIAKQMQNIALDCVGQRQTEQGLFQRLFKVSA